MAQRSTHWSTAEIEAAVDGYFDLWTGLIADNSINKREFVDALGRRLGRSRPSIEYRFRNISAVLEANGAAYMPGYVPARNAGSSVEAMILEAIRNHEVDHHHPAPGRGKQGVVNSICEISGVEPTALRRGSTVPSSVFDAALEFIGIPDRDGDMPTRAQRIIESVGGSWKPSFASSGSTVTLEGLEAVLAALQEVAASRCTYDADEALRIGSLLPDHPPASAPRPRQPAPRLTVTLEIERIARDPAVVKEVLDRAAGVCEACGDEAPFVREDGKPFLEVHHVLALSDGGSDRPENAVACCPNCHRAFHHASDRVRRKESLYREISALERE